MRYASSALFLSFLLWACGGDGGGDLTEPTTGTLEITTTTSGSTEAAGYTVSLDGTTAEPIGLNASLTQSEVATGSHVVQLGGLPDGCTVSGENPRGVSVTAGETATVAFAISCVPLVGAVRVTTATTGPAPTGYDLLLDGASQGSIAPNAVRALEGLALGIHSVGLSGVPANCQLEGENPRSAEVSTGSATEASFAITCTPPPAQTGSISISVATNGAGRDPDGYVIVVDGGAPQPIGLSGNILLTNVTVGSHTVAISGLAANCSLSGPNLQNVILVADATVSVSFAVQCTGPEPTTASIRITTVTTGPGSDADGYTFTIDDQAAQPIGVSADVTVGSLAAGSHTVELGGLASNCTLSSDNPRAVTLVAGATADVSFSIACAAPPPATGSLTLTTTTTGTLPDADGYMLTIDEGTAQPVETNGSVTIDGLSPGPHSVTIAGIAGNCTLSGDNPRTVEVVAGETTTAGFAISCTAPAPPIAFTSNGLGLLSVFLVNPDGTGLRELSRGSEPVWSPDGQKILVSVDDDLYVMNGDGTNRTALVTGDEGVADYRWSADGRKIAFVVQRMVSEDFFEDLWVMQADGTDRLRLAENARRPTWSPSGTRLAYVGDGQIRIVNVDGTGDTRLTSEDMRAFQPSWSPDGTRIAFVTIGDKDLHLINPDGSGLVNITQGQADDDGPSWSPDGGRIAFMREPLGQVSESEITVMNRDGTNQTILTHRAGFDITPNWSPDGQRIVFQGSEPNDSEIFVMNADGSDLRNVSNRPTTHESTPAWAGGGMGATLRSGEGGSLLRRRLSSP